MYSAKHKGSGSYGVVNPNGEWFEIEQGKDFLGTKEEAQAKASELNASIQSDANQNQLTDDDQDGEASNESPNIDEDPKQNDVVETKKQDLPRACARFVLTEDGWLKKGV